MGVSVRRSGGHGVGREIDGAPAIDVEARDGVDPVRRQPGGRGGLGETLREAAFDVDEAAAPPFRKSTASVPVPSMARSVPIRKTKLGSR